MTVLFFVVLNLFVVYTLWHLRHRSGSRFAYEPESKRVEHWLTGITTIGNLALLAPDLVVDARYAGERVGAKLEPTRAGEGDGPLSYNGARWCPMGGRRPDF